jgi:hypothetical protein
MSRPKFVAADIRAEHERIGKLVRNVRIALD